MKKLQGKEIDEIAVEFKVNPSHVKAIIMQESAWNSYAIRYEVNYKWLYEPERFAKSGLISLSTELVTQKMSWGLGQIMGALAREQGHTGLMAELLDPKVNVIHICIRLAAIQKKVKNPDEIFSVYNGGFGALKTTDGKFKNEDYVKSALRHLIKYE